MSTAASKAEQLVARGVRRVFGIDLGKRRVVEWSRELGSWSILATDAVIEDRALAVPLPLRVLVDAVFAEPENYLLGVGRLRVVADTIVKGLPA